jgi:hypothetical protein
MQSGTVGFQTWEAQSNVLPSPSVWSDALGDRAVDEGSGYQILRDFKNGSTGLIFAGGTAAAASFNRNYDSVLQLSTGSGNTANGVEIYCNPLGVPTLASQNQLRFEAIVAITQTADANAIFVGLANFASVSTTQGIVSTSSSTAASNVLSPGSKVGFWMKGSSTTNIDAVYQSGTSAAVIQSAGVLNASAFSAGSTQNALQGAQTGAGTQPPTTPFPWTASTFIKFGVVYDGIKNWSWFVNGILVAKLDGTGLIDHTASYAGVIGIAAPGSVGDCLNVAYFRAAYAPKAY